MLVEKKRGGSLTEEEKRLSDSRKAKVIERIVAVLRSIEARGNINSSFKHWKWDFVIKSYNVIDVWCNEP